MLDSADKPSRDLFGPHRADAVHLLAVEPRIHEPLGAGAVAALDRRDVLATDGQIRDSVFEVVELLRRELNS
jgi:hypothetical protein